MKIGICFSRFLLFLSFFISTGISAQTAMTNVSARNKLNLNGSWQIIVDWYNRGAGMGIYKDKQPENKTVFYEFAFANQILKVPADWNSQDPKLQYYEGDIWYKKVFDYSEKNGVRTFIHFAAVNYSAEVFFNGHKIGSHEGGFTPFQIELTGLFKDKNNSLVVRVNNQRREDAIPALSFDWWNYGGITRDVTLIETPNDYIEDYFIQLQKESYDNIGGWVKISGHGKSQKITISIPEIGVSQTIVSDTSGYAYFNFKAKVKLWSPVNPKIYQVKIASTSDSTEENIGFRQIQVKGTDILLNGESIFLKGISFHEEIASEMRRAVSKQDAIYLLSKAKELGCNFVRLAHYPQNEYIVKMADEMGIMLWEEIPVWQGIQFSNPVILLKAELMLREMVQRDKNRSSIIIWSLSNETNYSPDRNAVLSKMASLCRRLDPTRLVSSAFHQFKNDGNKITIDDSLSNVLDVIAVNKYMGWYAPWRAGPGNIVWESNFNKPIVFSEFGGEAKFGIHGSADTANLWTEEFQEKLYEDNIRMFKKMPFLRGTCPWILFDFRTPFRMHPNFQEGYNRKGLLSEKGEKKKAWYVMRNFYDSIPYFRN